VTILFSRRSLDPTKIIYDDKRLRFSFVGITDILSIDPNQQNPFHLVNHYQQVRLLSPLFTVSAFVFPRSQDDLTALGKLIVALACRCLQSVHRDQIQISIDLISRHYSSDLKNLITYLLSPNKMKSIVEGEMLATSLSIETQLNLSSHAQNRSTLLHASRASGESCRHDGE
jgi:PAB-dependent poly(A)-specific ribonuclease subunit 3